jgi:hypothetical protein
MELKIEVPDEKIDKIKNLVREELEKDKLNYRLELVKIITRAKGSVCNWKDLEEEIMRGSI